MENNDDKDEKRRVMTPPPEWGGDEDDDFLGGDSSWLSVPDEEPAGEERADDSKEAAEPDMAPTPHPVPEDTDSAADDKIMPESSGGDEDLGWLTSDALGADPEADTDTKPDARNTRELVPDVSDEPEEPPAPADPPKPEEEDDDWLDAVDDLALAPPTKEEAGITEQAALSNNDTSWEPSLSNTPEPEVAPEISAPKPSAMEPSSSNPVWISEPETAPEHHTDTPQMGASNPQPPEETAPAASEALLTDHRVAAEMPPRKLPIWPIAAVVLALVLVGVGGWGAFAERAELQARVADLESQLARKRKQGDLSQEEEEVLRSDNQSLRLQLATLREQYASLAAEIERLEQQLLTTNGAVAESEDSDPAMVQADPIPEPPEQVSKATAPAATAITPAKATERAEPMPTNQALPETSEPDGWFVNIASYSRKDIAEEWANRIRQVADNVTLQDIDVNGKLLHRVRVLGYASEAEARKAAEILEKKYNTGPLWIGKMKPENSKRAAVKPETQASSQQDQAATPVALKTISSGGGWFVYVDTFSRGVDADEKAKTISNAGYDAKVAVEYRSGELFYRVQVVGIDSRETGERIVEELAALDDMPNLQLRQY